MTRPRAPAPATTRTLADARRWLADVATRLEDTLVLVRAARRVLA
jgi:hypothetical protein